MQEGVTKFQAHHRHAPLQVDKLGDTWRALLSWRRVLHDLGVVGQDLHRYDGAGYGNMSARLHPFSYERGKRRFLITGTQTGKPADLSIEELCVVESYDVKGNSVHSFGEIAPSSESLTHGAIYDLNPNIRFVFHGHVPSIWNRAQALGLPTTAANVPYGTQAMAFETARLYRSTNLSESKCYTMGGHEDGVVTFGRTASEAGEVLVRILARAHAICL